MQTVSISWPRNARMPRRSSSRERTTSSPTSWRSFMKRSATGRPGVWRESAVLHIHNGDCSANSAGAAGIEGQHVAWREALMVGPATSPEAREQFLATEYGASPAEVARDLSRVRRL